MYGPLKFFWLLILEVQMQLKMALQDSHTPTSEDILIDKLLGHKKKGFYVDIGACDPNRFSNTKKFYDKGWRGINIEPNTTGIEKFNRKRPRDINLNIGISDKNCTLNFFKFEPESLSTFSRKVAQRRQNYGYKLIETTPVKVYKLSEVLAKYHKGGPIDFFSIDTEGFEYQILKSNDWKKFKPTVICLEFTSIAMSNPNTKKPVRKLTRSIEKMLTEAGYKKAGSTVSNQLFQLSS